MYSVFQGLICIWVELPKGSIIRNLNISQNEEGILGGWRPSLYSEITLHNSAYAFGRLFCFQLILFLAELGLLLLHMDFL